MDTKSRSICRKFGESLKQQRTARSLTQEELAQLANLHPTYISQIERGKRNITLTAIQKLSSALEIPIRFFFE